MNTICMLTSDLCRIPDHSILYGKFKLSYIESVTLPPKVSNKMSHTESDLKSFNQLHKRYKVDPISENFMSSDIWKKTLDNLIECIEQRSASQENVDRIYKELTEKIFCRNG